ncbi:MAG TPA: TetR/AcrR family transcriptional regulator [Syntrophorhabdaceae bacterium]|nr:TetR/AcrR family transcriptional regulator [Syntrophorhabdaceae bacterium]HNT69165.1 TetR/AcrR family transcriptional regulator [Syntrophorhabdaceae bacterium]
MKHADKRNEIIIAALELISEQGFHKAPMSMIARKAGVGAGTIYIYFENKDALINEIYMELEKKITAAIQEGYSVSQPIRERFMHLWIGLLRYIIEHPLDFRYMEQYHNSPYGASLRRDRILGKTGDSSIFKDLFEEGISSHTIKELPIVMIFALAFGPMVCLARDHILGLIKLQDAHIVKAAAACWEAIENK